MTRRIVRGLVCLITIPLFLAFGPHDDPNVTPDSSANAAPVGIGQGGPFATERIQVFGHLTLSEIGGGPANICLLYTSPSPRDQRGSRMPSSA